MPRRLLTRKGRERDHGRRRIAARLRQLGVPSLLLLLLEQQRGHLRE
jgi:hypothetical protein